MSEITTEKPAQKFATTAPAFVVGDAQAKRFNGKTVAFFVFVNCDMNSPTRGRTDGCFPIHELPLVRRMFQAEGGDITIRADWVAGIPRHRNVTDLVFRDEMARLRTFYQLKNGTKVTELMTEVYGASEVEQTKKVHAKMKEVYFAWLALYDAAKAKVLAQQPDIEDETLALFPADVVVTRKILDQTIESRMWDLTAGILTAKDFGTLEAIVEPARSGADELEIEGFQDEKPVRARLEEDEVVRPATKKPLPQFAGDDGLSDALSSGGSIEVSERVQKALEAKGHAQTTALEIATLHMDHPTLPDDVLAQIPTLKHHAMTYKAVRKVVAEAVAAPADMVEV